MPASNAETLPERVAFETAYEAGTTQLVYRRVINDVDTPVSAFLKMAKDRPYGFLYESVQGGEQRGRYSFLGYAPDIVLRTAGDQVEIARGKDSIAKKQFEPVSASPIDALRQLQSESAFDLPEDIPPMAAGLFGYMGYDMIRHIERIGDPGMDAIGTPDSIMIRPTLIAIFDLIAQEVILATPCRPATAVTAATAYEAANQRLNEAAELLSKALDLTSLPEQTSPVDVPIKTTQTQDSYLRSVDKAKDYIRAGDIFQVVLGQRFEAVIPASPFSLYRSLRRLNPSPFLFYLNFDDHVIVGSSPEILVRRRDNTVTVRPIAGTRPRGQDRASDFALEAELLADPKERSEHLMLLDLGRNDVGRVSKAGSVTVTDSFMIERYSHVMHIVSNVEGQIKEGCDSFDAMFAGFPAGTVSGAPKVRAMQIIDELETEKRGIYAGAVGYLSASGDMDTAIALRTAIIKDSVMHVRAGAGIVLDSDPKAEYDECRHKARALFEAARYAPQFESQSS